ncbi:type II secretion system F family protein [Tsukamurella soli]|uniref:type II secretion system F family protein n=1 Tax=Tsukamurella soli TaxID=644556 RepID=UPI00360725E0
MTRERAILALPLVAVTAGPLCVLAAVILTLTLRQLFAAGRRRRVAAERDAAVVEAVAAMTAELGVGAHPAAACREAAGESPHPGVRRTLDEMASRAALGGDVAAGIRARCGDDASWARIAVAWETGSRHGVPIADLLAAVRADLLARARFAERSRSALAGARATATVLACLPVLGIGLGQAIGANPVRILLGGSGIGGIMLVVGVTFTCAGLLWAAAITRGADGATASPGADGGAS